MSWIKKEIPLLGDIKYGRDIGHHNDEIHKFIWFACENCGRERWVFLKKGKPTNRLCKECNYKRLRIRGLNSRKFFVNRDKLEELYSEKQLSCEEIGSTFNVDFSTVWKWLKKYDIPRRKPVDALINAVRNDPVVKRKIAESNSRREYSQESRRRASERFKRLWQDPSYRNKQAKVKREGRGDKKHKELILSEMKNLQEQGFRTIEVDSKPVPDIIAIKGDNLKVYAVEVETYGTGKPDYQKYDSCHTFDDVIWVIRRSKNAMG